MKLHTTLTRKHALAAVLVFSAISSLTGSRMARPLRRAAGFFLAPLGDAPMYAVTALKSQLAGGGDEELSVEDARRLREENRYLRWLASQWRYQSEVHRRRAEDLANFQRLYGPVGDLACELIPARVVAAGGLPYDRSRLVRVTARRDIRQGTVVTTRQLLTRRSKSLPPRLAVVSATALVGRIVEPGSFTARLQLLTDRGFAMAGRIRRIINPRRPRMITVTDGKLPREMTLTPANNLPIDDVMVRGDGASGLIAEHVKEYHNIRAGDLLVTGDSDALVPTEIHIGEVVEVRRDRKDPRRVTVHVRPHADLESLRDVYILSPMAPPPGGP